MDKRLRIDSNLRNAITAFITGLKYPNRERTVKAYQDYCTEVVKPKVPDLVQKATFLYPDWIKSSNRIYMRAYITDETGEVMARTIQALLNFRVPQSQKIVDINVSEMSVAYSMYREVVDYNVNYDNTFAEISFTLHRLRSLGSILLAYPDYEKEIEEFVEKFINERKDKA